MSKQRQRDRAAREADAARQAAQRAQDRQVAAAQRARAERRRLWWARLRLWQHGPGFGRQRERWGALGTIVLLVLLVVYVWTRSVAATGGAALICVIAAPALAAFVIRDRSKP
ncbi:hypothetical protein [Jatrophihabitans endophyticus]|uniref:hypothetical protein n=1 Tax=Jatrophihabitans endophyticus TaxID=1206085 RepID=UPI0019F273E8|nr:hypothetical protein [Jatrophihabitans endophyticus]MBE7186968.1 hypothetical protein [Jatrophihabitans endophyticus]